MPGKAPAKRPVPKAKKPAAKPAPRKAPAARKPVPRVPRKSPGVPPPKFAAPEPAAAPPVAAPPPAPPAQPAWAPAPTVPPAPRQLPFDPQTGAWRNPEQRLVAFEHAEDPAAPRRGTAAILLNVLLGLDIALVALNLVASLAVGLILILAPNSDAAQKSKAAQDVGSSAGLLAETLLTFTLFGLIPLAWVFGTRRKAWAGGVKFLQLKGKPSDAAKGALLVIPLLVAVGVLISLYVLATQGPDALLHPNQDNPAVDAILAHLTWPLAIVVAAAAGIGEETFFRGLLQKRLGVWGQAVVFGLAHFTGGYLPQVLFAFGLGVLFGFLVKRGWPLWALMVAHGLYDFTLLAASLLHVA